MKNNIVIVLLVLLVGMAFSLSASQLIFESIIDVMTMIFTDILGLSSNNNAVYYDIIVFSLIILLFSGKTYLALSIFKKFQVTIKNTYLYGVLGILVIGVINLAIISIWLINVLIYCGALLGGILIGAVIFYLFNRKKYQSERNNES